MSAQKNTIAIILLDTRLHSDLARYRNFLGMKDEAANIKASQAAMKLQGDFTSPDNLEAVAATKAAGTPADAFLAADNLAEVQSTAQALKDNDKVFGFDDAAAARAEAAAMKVRCALQRTLVADCY